MHKQERTKVENDPVMAGTTEAQARGGVMGPRLVTG